MLDKTHLSEIVRIDLMVQGVRLPAGFGHRTRSRMTVCNGVMIRFHGDGTHAKVPVVSTSPYALDELTGPWCHLHDLRDPRLSLPVQILRTPSWAHRSLDSGREVGDVLKPLHESKASASAFGCQVVDAGLRCTFCTASGFKGHRFEPEELRDALDATPEITDLMLNSGSFTTDDERGYNQLAPFVRSASSRVESLNVEMMPPTTLTITNDRAWFGRVLDDGASSLQINLELWPNDLRLQLMPFKGRQTHEEFLDILNAAVLSFGKGRVGSVLLVGFQPQEALVEAAAALIDTGVLPLLEVYRPPRNRLDFGVDYAIRVRDDVAAVFANTQFMEFYESIQMELQGCATCGGCSVKPLSSQSLVQLSVNRPCAVATEGCDAG